MEEKGPLLRQNSHCNGEEERVEQVEGRVDDDVERLGDGPTLVLESPGQAESASEHFPHQRLWAPSAFRKQVRPRVGPWHRAGYQRSPLRCGERAVK